GGARARVLRRERLPAFLRAHAYGLPPARPDRRVQDPPRHARRRGDGRDLDRAAHHLRLAQDRAGRADGAARARRTVRHAAHQRDRLVGPERSVGARIAAPAGGRGDAGAAPAPRRGVTRCGDAGYSDPASPACSITLPQRTVSLSTKRLSSSGGGLSCGIVPSLTSAAVTAASLMTSRTLPASRSTIGLGTPPVVVTVCQEAVS